MLTAAVKGSFSKQLKSNRKLPRIPLNVILQTENKNQVEILNFNYEYILIKNTESIEDNIVIIWGEGLKLQCVRIEEQQNGKSILFKVKNWQELHSMPSFRERTFSMLQEKGALKSSEVSKTLALS